MGSHALFAPVEEKRDGDDDGDGNSDSNDIGNGKRLPQLRFCLALHDVIRPHCCRYCS